MHFLMAGPAIRGRVKSFAVQMNELQKPPRG